MTVRVVVVAAILAAGFAGGYKLRDWQADATISGMLSEAAELRERAIADARSIERLSREKSQAADAIAALRERKAETVERVITQEVIKYVQTDNASRCGVDADGVRLLNAAARGVPPDREAPGKADAATGGATNAELVSSVTRNYATCHRNENRLRDLQAWVKANTE